MDASTCLTCHLGRLQTRRVTYLLAFEGEHVTVPNCPAWVCDVCGELSYDEETLVQLEMLVGVDAELEPGRRPRTRRPSPEEAAAAQAAFVRRLV